jgi:hypothetical protein
MRIILVAIVVSAGVASAEPLTGRVTDISTGNAVEGALVYVGGVERSLTTDDNGRYEIEVAPGTYNVIIAHGSSRTTRVVVVEPNKPAQFDARVDSASGEVIVIEDRSAPAKVTNFKPNKAPPYSDEAVLSDAWTRAWLLLDVDEIGKVRRIKFLQHPGYDLEKIAHDEAFKLTFEPARNRDGKPIRSWVVWDIEWPSAWWLSLMIGTRSAMPPIVGFPPRRLDWYIPCRGSGPLNLQMAHPVYRDCSRPDLSKAAKEKWIDR